MIGKLMLLFTDIRIAAHAVASSRVLLLLKNIFSLRIQFESVNWIHAMKRSFAEKSFSMPLTRMTTRFAFVEKKLKKPQTYFIVMSIHTRENLRSVLVAI